MKNYYLNKEEQETINDVEKALKKGALKSTMTTERLRELREAAAIKLESLQKDKSINIRISSKDLQALKQKAHDNALPYQTIVSMLIHQYNQGKLKIEI